MINVERLGFAIEGRTLFEDLSFHIPKGSIAAILGPNGRGKTTLLRLIQGLQKGGSGRANLNARSAYVPQLTQSLFTYDVTTMVSLGRVRHLAWYATPTRKDSRIIAQCIDYLGLTQLAHQAFNRLSGGEKQMVMIARALASEPDILILDEPTSALDLYNQNGVLKVLRELAADRGMTILFTSHYPQHALHIADLALLLFPDSGYSFGAAASVMSEERLKKLYRLPINVIEIKQYGRSAQAVVPLFD